ncbi:MAG: Crp/Fnr family transcriptional regulator [Clostridia bacterium]|nr:Crp/Fnr family transcriptional regulator [Clostridia bacterium]
MENCTCNNIYSKYFPFWNTLAPGDRELLCAGTSEAFYKKGQPIHDGGGGDCTGTVFVKSGCIRVYILSEDGKEVTLYRLFEGDFCMLSASCVIQAVTFDVYVNAEEDSECYILNPKIFSDVSERNTAMKIFALETAVERFSDVMWVMQQILFFSLDKRIAVFLYDEMTKNNSDTVKLTHEQIARYINSAREAVSRMLKYFSAEGIVELSRNGVKIIDKKKLKAKL